MIRLFKKAHEMGRRIGLSIFRVEPMGRRSGNDEMSHWSEVSLGRKQNQVPDKDALEEEEGSSIQSPSIGSEPRLSSGHVDDHVGMQSPNWNGGKVQLVQRIILL